MRNALKRMDIIMKILVFEPNNHHYEILPGFCQLFIKQGHDVDLLVRSHLALGDEFCRANISVRVFYYDEDGYTALSKLCEEGKYDCIFVSSFDHIENGQLINSVKKIEDLDLGIPYFGCFHDLSNISKYENNDLLRKGRIVALSEYTYDNICIPMVNPQYFSLEIERHQKNEMASFVMVGTNIWRNELEHSLDSERLKGMDYIIESIGAFDEQKYRRNRLKRRFFYPIAKLFNISKYSNPNMNPATRKAIQRIVNVGKLPFPEMYSTIERADFILLNIKVYPNTDFIMNKTSGSKQLALGFRKPPILPEEIAKAYGFDNTNAIVYHEGHLDEALLKACNLSNEGYQQMTDSLDKLSEIIENKSLDNLKNIIERLMP